jgi:biopolymer transport protein TolR
MAMSVQRGVGRNGGRRRHRRARVNSEINVTPLVDVMLVLLIVFMVAAPLLSVGVPIDLPKTDAKALPSQQEPLTITVDSQGRVFLQEEEVLIDDLIPKLVAVSDTGYDERIFLRGDENSDYGAVMKVMARINAAGFSNLNLVTDPVSQ